MKSKELVIISHIIIIVLLISIGISGCRSGNEIITEAKNLCEESDGLVHEASSTIEGEESSIGLQPSAPALVLRKVTYKKFSRWGELFLLPDYLRSRTDASTIVCISESRNKVANYESGAEAYHIIWTVQLIGYPDGKIFTSKKFQSTYDPPTFKSGFSDIYSDPPDEEQVSNWILSELKRKSAIVSDRSIRDIALSPDGETLVIADGENVQIWDVETETLIHRIEEVNTEKVTFSQDGKFLAGASLGIVHIFETNNYENISSFVEQGSEILALDFSPDGKLLATGNKDETVIILDVGTLQIAHSFPGEDGTWERYPKYRVMFLPDGNTLVGGGNNGCLKVWDVLSGENIDAPIRCSSRNKIMDMAISSDGKFLAIGWEDGGVLIRDTSTWKIIDNFSNDALNPEPTKGIVFLPGKSILVGNIQDNLTIWDVETFKTLAKIKMDMEKIVAFPDGKHIALFYKHTVRILDIEELISK